MGHDIMKFPRHGGTSVIDGSLRIRFALPRQELGPGLRRRGVIGTNPDSSPHVPRKKREDECAGDLRKGILVEGLLEPHHRKGYSECWHAGSPVGDVTTNGVQRHQHMEHWIARISERGPQDRHEERRGKHRNGPSAT